MNYKNIFTKINNIAPQTKKTLKRVVLAGAICAVLGGGASAYADYATEVEGTVTAINGQVLTVQDKFMTRTVNLAGSAFNSDRIRKGDKIDIEKNINGDILSIKLKAPQYLHDHRYDKKHRYEKDHRDNDDRYDHDDHYSQQELSVEQQAANAQAQADRDRQAMPQNNVAPTTATANNQ